MIAASEPLEFIPHGRNVMNRHPGSVNRTMSSQQAAETSLLLKMKNVMISENEFNYSTHPDGKSEWWCVRQVYAKSLKEADTDIKKTDKNRNMKQFESSESINQANKLKSEFNFSIKSEILSSTSKKTDGDSNLGGSSRRTSVNSTSNMSKKFNLSNSPKNTLNGSRINKRKEDPKTDCWYEEELYVKGRTAVWSKGLISTPATRLTDAEARETIACYTCDHPIKHALFCNFYDNLKDRMLLDFFSSEYKTNIKIEDSPGSICDKVYPSVCLIDLHCIKVFTLDGNDYITNLNFQVRKVWAMKFGILLEKDATPALHNSLLLSHLKLRDQSLHSRLQTNKSNLEPNIRFNVQNNTTSKCTDNVSELDPDLQLPVCFSLTHPLDEMTPVLLKSQNGLQYYNESSMTIVFVSITPSICLIYDSKTGLHSLWKVRKATREECLSSSNNFNSSASVLSQSVNLNFGSMSGTSNIGQKMQKNTGVSWQGGGSSSFLSKPGSAGVSPLLSRFNSPLPNVFSKQGISPHTSTGQASNISMGTTYQTTTVPSLPLFPDTCFDHIWTESQSGTREISLVSPASKCFLHTDHTEQDYLCYLTRSTEGTHLQVVRLQNSYSYDNYLEKHIIVGTVSSLPARDAVSLDTLRMFALIDESSNIILYAGMCMVGKVHVGGVLAGLINSPYNKMTSFNSPFPRRSSLLPCRTTEAPPVLDESALSLLSPVPHTFSSMGERSGYPMGLKGLRDPVGSRLTLEYDRGVFYRISLPDFASCSLVENCLNALKIVLKKDVAMQVVVKWYGVRNAPGTQDFCPEQEWSMFVSLLFSMLGYDIERLSFIPQPDSGETEVKMKKKRTSSDGTIDDWDYLLDSKLHQTIGSSLAHLLHFQTDSGRLSKQDYNKIDIHKYAYKRKDDIDTAYGTSSSYNTFNVCAPLFPYFLQVLYSLHLVYEEIKLNTLLFEDLQAMSVFLHRIASDLRLQQYVSHYWKDFPLHCMLNVEESDLQVSETDLKRLVPPTYFNYEPPNIFLHICKILGDDSNAGSYPHLPNVNTVSRDIIQIIGYIASGKLGATQNIVTPRNEGVTNASSTPRSKEAQVETDIATIEKTTVLMLYEKGFTLRQIYNLPPSVSLIILNQLSRCKQAPPVDWPTEAYNLIMREDLALQTKISYRDDITSEYVDTLGSDSLKKETAYTQCNEKKTDELPFPTKVNSSEFKTGMEHLDTKVLRLLYPNDHRVAEVCNLLQSSIPVTINITQRPDVSDHDFIEEQERQLYAISARTMALPIARGMVTLRTSVCVPTEPLQMARLCVSGRSPPPRCGTIELPHSSPEQPPPCTQWPTFHSGVAAGLALVPLGGEKIDSTWVVYNKIKGTNEMSNEHAGFLMALGLNGHLKDMASLNIYEYLVKGHEMTIVGLLLGIAATYRGTMNVSATKMMGIHLEALLPPTSMELEIAQNVQVTALLGVGLIYEGTMHTHIAQVLLNEIGRPPGPEMENSAEREGYALAAGLALGLVCLRAHATAPHHLPAALRHYMLGGTKRPLTGAQKEKYKQPSFQIREGWSVNVDVTGPGATLALGLLQLRSGNRAAADWLAPPPTQHLLHHVRPDLLMLRIISRGLILWDEIEPYEEWVEAQVPTTIRQYSFVKPTEDHIDYEAMNQAYCNIVAGACFCIGLRYAGSACEDARDCLMTYVRQFMNLASKSIGELAGKSTIETCLNVILISAGMVMAGTGDVAVMRACRGMRYGSALSHGSHAAAHSALGLLFLGGGRCSLSTEPHAVAALLCAFFPKFPTHSNDNRYHLQAFRHLYVLAVEPRLLIARDISSGSLCIANIQLLTLDQGVLDLQTPCILPHLHTLKEVRINDSRYWPMVFQRDRNWEQLKLFLENSWCIDIKQRAGCLSYLEDPQGFQSLLAQTLTLEKSNIWSAKPENILAFTSDQAVLNFTRHYLINSETTLGSDRVNATPKSKNNIEENGFCSNCYFVVSSKKGECGYLQVQSSSSSDENNKNCVCNKSTREEKQFIQTLAMITYECVIKDNLCVLPLWITLVKMLRNMKTNPSVYHIWQFKLLIAHIENHNSRYVPGTKVWNELDRNKNDPLISNEFANALKQQVLNIIDGWEFELLPHLKKYLGINNIDLEGSVKSDILLKRLSTYVAYYDLPQNVLKNVDQNTDISLLQCIMELDNYNLSINTIGCVSRILS